MVPDSEWGGFYGLIGGDDRCFSEEEKTETDLADIVRHALAGDAFSVHMYAQEHGIAYQQAKAGIQRLLASGQIKELIRLGSSERSARYVWIWSANRPFVI